MNDHDVIVFDSGDYTQAEHLYQLHGVHGEDPTDLERIGTSAPAKEPAHVG